MLSLCSQLAPVENSPHTPQPQWGVLTQPRAVRESEPLYLLAWLRPGKLAHPHVPTLKGRANTKMKSPNLDCSWLQLMPKLMPRTFGSRACGVNSRNPEKL